MLGVILSMADKRKQNGEGTVYKDVKNNRWVAEISWVDKAKKKHRKRFTAKTQTEVKAKLKEHKRLLAIDENTKNSNDILFEEYANRWLNTVLRQKLKPSSYARKKGVLVNQVYPILGDFPLIQITYDDVQNMVNILSAQGLSYSTIKKAYEAVSGVFKNYRIKNQSTLNPCEGVTLPENAKREVSDIKWFNNEQRQLIKAEALRKYSTGKSVYRMGCLIIALMYTGMRVGELLALEWADIDFENKQITIDKNTTQINIDDKGELHYNQTVKGSTKTKSGKRVIPMTSEAKKALLLAKDITGDQEYVCSTENGKLITESNIYRMLQNVQLRTGIAKTKDECLRVHDLRHTFASMLFNNGCDVQVVSDLLGHADTSVTRNIYIHLIQEQKVKAIENIDKYSN